MLRAACRGAGLFSLSCRKEGTNILPLLALVGKDTEEKGSDEEVHSLRNGLHSRSFPEGEGEKPVVRTAPTCERPIYASGDCSRATLGL
jgi:hypothetical protein